MNARLILAGVLASTLILSVSALAKDISVSVKGMVCGFCAQGIEKKFKALPEIASVNVSLETKTVTITTKEKMDVSDGKIQEILKDAGYNVEKIQR
jgi:mercuric ion binding protein